MEPIAETEVQEQVQPQLTDRQLFTQLWIRPRRVFRYINDTAYDKFMIPLLILAGISRALDRASLKDMGDERSLGQIIFFSLIGGGLLGWLTFYIYAALLSFTGKWLKGQGDTKSILRAMAYGMFPMVLILVLLIPQMAIYGNEIFKSEGNIYSAGTAANVLVYTSMGLEMVLGVYTLVLCTIGISEVQKLSIGKTILNILLPGTIIIGCIAVLLLMTKRF